MSVRVDCKTCRARDVDTEHVERCGVRTKARADAVAHGRGDIGIHGGKTDTLWSHAFSRTGDPLLALDVTRLVIDLGWRPVVGRYDTWKPPLTPEQPPADHGDGSGAGGREGGEGP